jgi:hypothetical protein
MADFTLRKATEEFPSFPGEKAEEHGQHVTFNVGQLPEISSWEPGHEYMLVVKVMQKAYRVHKQDGDMDESADFEVLEVGAMKDHDDDKASHEVAKRLIKK